jgi:uncharacterized protein YecT (DUF1311 family)
MRQAMSVAMLLLGVLLLTARAQDSTACPSTIHCAAMPAEHVAWLRSLTDGESSRDATLASRFAALVGAAVPDAVYHFHVDMPLAEAFTAIMRGPAQPIQVRDGRYTVLAACQSASCAGARAFLWVDTGGALAIGAIQFNPSNGEPTPTQTIFASQVQDPITSMSQLPSAFVQDLARWTSAGRTTPPMARYFVNGKGVKTPVPHEEDACLATDARSSQLPIGLCAPMNLANAEQDLAAALYLLNASFAEGTKSRADLKAEQGAWVKARDSSCGAAATLEEIACRVTYTRERTKAVIAVYMKPFASSASATR